MKGVDCKIKQSSQSATAWMEMHYATLANKVPLQINAKKSPIPYEFSFRIIRPVWLKTQASQVPV